MPRSSGWRMSSPSVSASVSKRTMLTVMALLVTSYDDDDDDEDDDEKSTTARSMTLVSPGQPCS